MMTSLARRPNGRHGRQTRRTGRWVVVAGLIALGGAAAGSTAGAQTSGGASSVASAKADAFLVVDCLLPGQIRRLGPKMTFLAARRPTKTTTRDCEIRGGEYVSYDRANYATALKVWMEGATQGDPKAQTYVGEIYEKGLGTPSDHAAAAQWYRRAAEQGYAPAAINLGNLYERGLGVARDPAEALRWYRAASGLPDASFAIAPDPNDAKVAQLEGEIEQYRRELHARQGDLDQAQRELLALRADLGHREGEVQGARSELEDLRRERAALEAGGRTATAEMERLRKTIDDRTARLQAAERTASELRARLARTQAPAASPKAAESEREVQGLQNKLARAESEMRAQRAGLDPVRWERDPAGPDIELLSVQVVEPGADAKPGTPAAGRTLLVVGRVAAANAIQTFTINGIEQLIDASPRDTRFRAELGLRDVQDERIRLVAVDDNKRRCSAELMVPAPVKLVAAAEPARPAGAKPSTAPAPAGRYHALVIGVSEYGRMDRLETPVKDAEAVAQVLRQDYGFTVRLVGNASRAQILSELNELRERLTAKDNLLVYFAGRGELNSQSQRGYWLPADAEPNNPATWISDVQLSDILNVIPARQLLVVADSPYAATLTRSANGRLAPALKNEDLARAIESLSAKRARMVMTSGSMAPVADATGPQQSLFAASFLSVLRSNNGLMLGRDVYREVQVRVYAAARRLGFTHVPAYAPMKYAGHDGGEFFFVRKRS